MIKNNKIKLIISSLLILLPTVFGLIVWDKLPDDMVSHIGLDGTADGFSKKAFCVFALPLIILALHWLCLFLTSKDPKNKNQTEKAIGMIFWILPGTSIYVSSLMYSLALGMEFSYEVVTLILIGLMFIFIGNYLPKCKQNYTLGIKVKWTIENEENWNATHRFGGKLWVICGVVFMLCAFLPEKFIAHVLVSILIPAAVLPVIYSYVYYKKQIKNGTYEITQFLPPTSRIYKIITVVCLVAMVIFVPLISYTGNIEIIYGDDDFTVKADYYDDVFVNYDSITDIEYRESAVDGLRTNGFGSFRLLMGQFKNEEFGYYTRFTYYKDGGCVVLTVGDEKLVLGGINKEATKEIYDSISERITTE